MIYEPNRKSKKCDSKRKQTSTKYGMSRLRKVNTVDSEQAEIFYTLNVLTLHWNVRVSLFVLQSEISYLVQ